MEAYVVAVKRQCRDVAPDNWVEQIESIEGVKLVGERGGRSVRVEGQPGTGKRLQEAVGSYCHIEPVIMHHRMQTDFVDKQDET